MRTQGLGNKMKFSVFLAHAIEYCLYVAFFYFLMPITNYINPTLLQWGEGMPMITINTLGLTVVVILGTGILGVIGAFFGGVRNGINGHSE